MVKKNASNQDAKDTQKKADQDSSKEETNGTENGDERRPSTAINLRSVGRSTFHLIGEGFELHQKVFVEYATSKNLFWKGEIIYLYTRKEDGWMSAVAQVDPIPKPDPKEEPDDIFTCAVGDIINIDITITNTVTNTPVTKLRAVAIVD